MTTESLILLTPERRLDILIGLSDDAVARAKAINTEEAWDASVVAWEALHAELMHQVDQKKPVLDALMTLQSTPVEIDDRGPQD